MIRFLLAFCLAASIGGTAGADALDRILERGTVKLGVRKAAPPFSYQDENGEAAGLAVRLCNTVVQLIARHHNTQLNAEYEFVDARQRFSALAEDRTDLHCGPASATLRRRETLDFSLIYFVDGAAAAVRPDGSFDTIFETPDARFGVVDGTTTKGVVEDLMERNALDVTLRTYGGHAEGLAALAANEVDVYFGDQAILFFQIEAQGLIGELNVIEEVLSFEPYALAMKRGEGDLRLAVDRALSQIYETGLIYQMILTELGDYPLSTEAKTLYLVVGLPE